MTIRPRFKRLIGVNRTTFSQMVKILKNAYQTKHVRGGRKPKLSIENLLLATLQYLKEYRTYEQIAADYGIHESNLIRRSHWVEETLVKHGFNIGKQKIRPDDTVLIDATEVKIQRPKKQEEYYSGKKKYHVLKVQAITDTTGRIIHLDFCDKYRHDMHLLHESRRDLSSASLILADSGYQGLSKIYFQAKTPIKSNKKHPLTK